MATTATTTRPSLSLLLLFTLLHLLPTPDPQTIPCHQTQFPQIPNSKASLNHLRARRPSSPLLLRRESRRDLPQPQDCSAGDGQSRRPQRHHHQPPEQASRHRVNPHAQRGQGRREEALPAEEDGPSPTWVQEDWPIKINWKEKRLAISTAVASSAVNTIMVEDFKDKFERPKTKEFIAALRRWGIDPKEKSTF